MAPGKVIVISTHILEEVDAVCTRAIIIANGSIVADEKPAALVRRSRYHNAVTLRLSHATDLPAVADSLRELSEVSAVEVDEHGYAITAFPRSGANPLAVIGALASERRWPVEQLQVETGRLDEVFRDITTAPTATGAV
jgi:ABC-2 type transport system ATP-binding protein